MGTPWIITKVLWLRTHEPRVFDQTVKFIQVQDLVLKAFGAEDYYTDIPTMAFYGVWDIRTVQWSQTLCQLFDVDPAMFGTP